MENQSFSKSFTVDQSPMEVFNAINNVRGWWSEDVLGDTEKPGSEFTYNYKDVHRSRIRIIESVPAKKITWEVLDNYFNFTQDQKEWNGTKIIFDIIEKGDKTELRFTHQGLIPGLECFSACSGGWTQYIPNSLYKLITAGKGEPNSKNTAYTTYEVAARFHELAQQEKWFDIQDEFFSDDVKSIEPENSPYMKNAEGKENVRKKAETFVKDIEAVHRRYTSAPAVGGKYFAAGREVDITVKGHGRIQINQLMVYEVRDGKIISEQFFY